MSEPDRSPGLAAPGDRWRRLGAGLLTVVLAAVVGYGVVADEPTAAERLARLGSQIKCPVCEGNAIADSPARYARDMLAVVEEQIAAGRSDADILAYFEARYTDAIILDPPRRGRTLALWVLPGVALVGGAFLITRLRRPEARR